MYDFQLPIECASWLWNDPRMEVWWFCFSPLRMLFRNSGKVCHKAPSAASACWFADGFQRLSRRWEWSFSTHKRLLTQPKRWQLTIPIFNKKSTPENRHGTWKGKSFFKPPFLDSILLFQRVHLQTYYHLYSYSEHSSISPRTRGLRSTGESGILTTALVRSRCAMPYQSCIKFMGFGEVGCWWLKSGIHQLRLVVYPII